MNERHPSGDPAPADPASEFSYAAFGTRDEQPAYGGYDGRPVQPGYEPVYDGYSTGSFGAFGYGQDATYGQGADFHGAVPGAVGVDAGAYGAGYDAGYDTGQYGTVQYDTGQYGFDPAQYGAGQYDTGQYDAGALWAGSGWDTGAGTPGIPPQQGPGQADYGYTVAQWDTGGYDATAYDTGSFAFSAGGHETGQWDATAWDTGQQHAAYAGYEHTGAYEHGFTDGQGFGTQNFEGQTFDSQGFDGQTFAGQGFEGQGYADQTFDGQFFEGQPFDAGHDVNYAAAHDDFTAYNGHETFDAYAPQGYEQQGYEQQAYEQPGFEHMPDGTSALDATSEFAAVDFAAADAAGTFHGMDATSEFAAVGAVGPDSQTVPPVPDPEPDPAAVLPHQPRGAGRRRSPKPRRSALMTVAVPSFAVLGVAGAAAATVAGGAGESEEDSGTTTQAASSASEGAPVKPSKANKKLDTQLAGLSEDAGDFADRASRTQERIDLKERQEAERKKKAEEAARKEAMRPKFSLPVDQPGLSATFGSAGLNWMSLHSGIDFPVSEGTPVKAATDGEVTTQFDVSFGNMMKIKAADGTETWYCHLSSTKIRSGEVKAGDVIGYSGTTGNSTGPHLHFEYHPGGGDAADPLPWLRGKGLNPG